MLPSLRSLAARAEAMQWLAQDALDFGSDHYARLDGNATKAFRVAAAKIINATPA